MEGLRHSASLVPMLAAQRTFKNEPFALLDVGCSHGLDAPWRDFEADLVAHGIDPMVEECARLQKAEANPHIKYHPYFMGLPVDHPFVQSRKNAGPWTNNPWNRLSVVWAIELAEEKKRVLSQDAILNENRWDLSHDIVKTEEISPSEFLCRHGIQNLDFLKVDIDGRDLEVLVGLESSLDDLQLVGIALEVNYFGTDNPTDNTFHNMDRLLRRYGFELFGLTTRPYSRRALPSPFLYGFPAQTVSGGPLQGDAIYVRDVASPLYQAFSERLSAVKLLKAACIFDMIGLPDCAAEVLITFRTRLASIVDVEAALDAVTPEIQGRKYRYREYMNLFVTEPDLFVNRPMSGAVVDVPQVSPVAPILEIATTACPDIEPTVSLPFTPAVQTTSSTVPNTDIMMSRRCNKVLAALGLVLVGMGMGMPVGVTVAGISVGTPLVVTALGCIVGGAGLFARGRAGWRRLQDRPAVAMPDLTARAA